MVSTVFIFCKCLKPELKEQGLTAHFVERNYEMNFILDSRNGKVIVPEEELETKKVL